VIEFRLTDEGRDRFATATREHIGERFAIVVDGAALEAPVIRDAIMGGKGEISGGFTEASAESIVQSILPHRNDYPLVVVSGDR
jgi:preprotein translocase subunit SecD